MNICYFMQFYRGFVGTYPDGSGGGGCKHATGDYPFFVTPIDKSSLENCHHVTFGVDKSIKISIHVIC